MAGSNLARIRVEELLARTLPRVLLAQLLTQKFFPRSEFFRLSLRLAPAAPHLFVMHSAVRLPSLFDRKQQVAALVIAPALIRRAITR